MSTFKTTVYTGTITCKKDIRKTKCDKSFSAKASLMAAFNPFTSWLAHLLMKKGHTWCWVVRINKQYKNIFFFDNLSISCPVTENHDRINSLQFWFNIYVEKTSIDISDKVWRCISIIVRTAKFHAVRLFQFSYVMIVGKQYPFFCNQIINFEEFVQASLLFAWCSI